MTPNVPTPVEALAEGFGHHVREWSLRLGASSEHAKTAGDAARQVSLATSEGHVCVMVGELGEDASALRASLMASLVVGTPSTDAPLPLVLDEEGRLYLHRYFDYEKRLARRLVQAAATGLQGLVIISGGPGTGKTTRIVNQLAEMLASSPGLRIALAAPTGKAAARMTEAIRERAGHLPEALRGKLPSESFTIHRLLRYNPSSGFEHDADNSLPIDVLIIDEASMLDVALATRLLEAVPPGARIVLLGDKDQLSAVESGAVFAEISADRKLLPVEWLTKNYRFAQDSGIGRLADEIRGNAEALSSRRRGNDEAGAKSVISWLRANRDASVRWEEAAQAAALAKAGYERFIETVRKDSRDVPSITAAFSAFRALCAVREGPQGVDGLNREMTEHARNTLKSGAGEWYAGRPVMVLVNDYALKLFNGDVGIALPDAEGRLMVHFPEGETAWRAVAPARMPRHDTAFAMTVHKAQGSEFDEVLLVLPRNESRVSTRELVYTGITRARHRVTLCAAEGDLVAAIARQASRRSGLRSRIIEAKAMAS